jgi:hypothetical protein
MHFSTPAHLRRGCLFVAAVTPVGPIGGILTPAGAPPRKLQYRALTR